MQKFDVNLGEDLSEQNQCRNFWLEALRSGEYAQCKGSYRLRKNIGQCSWEEFDPVGIARAIFDDCHSEQDISNITGISIQLIKETIELNDSGYSFDEIADHLEEHSPL